MLLAKSAWETWDGELGITQDLNSSTQKVPGKIPTGRGGTSPSEASATRLLGDGGPSDSSPKNALAPSAQNGADKRRLA